MKRNPIIVGIDPGTTLGYAILDINGKLIYVNSSKELGLNDLLKIIISKGKIIAVGCDKKNVPSFVEKFAIQVGAKIISPKNDLLGEEKKDLSNNLKFKDSHQFDAYISAIFAFKSLRSLFRKIKLYILKNEKQNIQTEIIDLVIKKGISIKTAVEIIEQPQKETTKIIKKVINENLSKSDYLKLFDDYIDSKKIIDYQKKIIKDLRKKHISAEKESSKIHKKLLHKKEDKRIEYLKRDINNMNQKFENLLKENDLTQKKYQTIKTVLLNRNNFFVVKKIPDLGKSFTNIYEKLNLQKEDILFIENPTIVSETSINIIQKYSNILLSDNKFSNSLKHKNFILVNSKEFSRKEFNEIIFFKKEDIDKIKTSSDTLKQIIKDYKKSRNLL